MKVVFFLLGFDRVFSFFLFFGMVSGSGGVLGHWWFLFFSLYENFMLHRFLCVLVIWVWDFRDFLRCS